jgi:hypothetical protein
VKKKVREINKRKRGFDSERLFKGKTRAELIEECNRTERGLEEYKERNPGCEFFDLDDLSNVIRKEDMEVNPFDLIILHGELKDEARREGSGLNCRQLHENLEHIEFDNVWGTASEVTIMKLKRKGWPGIPVNIRKGLIIWLANRGLCEEVNYSFPSKEISSNTCLLGLIVLTILVFCIGIVHLIKWWRTSNSFRFKIYTFNVLHFVVIFNLVLFHINMGNLISIELPCVDNNLLITKKGYKYSVKDWWSIECFEQKEIYPLYKKECWNITEEDSLPSIPEPDPSDLLIGSQWFSSWFGEYNTKGSRPISSFGCRCLNKQVDFWAQCKLNKNDNGTLWYNYTKIVEYELKVIFQISYDRIFWTNKTHVIVTEDISNTFLNYSCQPLFVPKKFTQWELPRMRDFPVVLISLTQPPTQSPIYYRTQYALTSPEVDHNANLNLLF